MNWTYFFLGTTMGVLGFLFWILYKYGRLIRYSYNLARSVERAVNAIADAQTHGARLIFPNSVDPDVITKLRNAMVGAADDLINLIQESDRAP